MVDDVESNVVEIEMHDNDHNENGTMQQKRSEHEFAPLEGQEFVSPDVLQNIDAMCDLDTITQITDPQDRQAC
jgi:hypothetical protein